MTSMFKTALCVVSLSFALSAAALEPTAQQSALDGVWTLEKPMGKALLDANGGAPPLNAAGKQLYDKRRAQLAKNDTSFDLSVKCKPIGFPRVLWDGGPFDVIVNSHLAIFGYTWNRNHRTVDVSDKAPVLQIPRYYGTSTAHWEGDTFVVQSGLFNENTLLDSSGLPHSDNMMLVERYRPLDNGNKLEVRLTIKDDMYYTKPWDVVARFNRIPNGRIQEDVCEERSPFYKDLLKGR